VTGAGTLEVGARGVDDNRIDEDTIPQPDLTRLITRRTWVKSHPCNYCHVAERGVESHFLSLVIATLEP